MAIPMARQSQQTENSPLMRGLSLMVGGLGDEELQRDLQEIAQVPGGTEMLVTEAAEALGPEENKSLRLYQMGGSVEEERGGLNQYAEIVREGGRGDDDILLHVSPEEFEGLQAMWGQAEINPITGLPEYGFLSGIFKKLRKGVKKIVKNPIFQAVAPIALNMFVPGLGVALGSALGASAGAAGMVGSALIRAGLGAAAGGKKGALMGALTAPGVGGAAGQAVGLTGRTADILGTAALSGAGSKAIGGDFAQGAITGGLGEYMRPGMESAIEGGLTKAGEFIGGLGSTPAVGTPSAPGVPAAGVISGAPAAAAPPLTAPAIGATAGAPSTINLAPGAVSSDLMPAAIPPPVTAASPIAAPPTGTGAVSPITGAPRGPVAPSAPAAGDTSLMDVAPLLLAASSMTGAQEQPGPPELPPEFYEPLPQYTLQRGRRAGPEDYLTYGQTPGGESLFFDPAAYTTEEEEDTRGYQVGGPVYQSQQTAFGAPPPELMQASSYQLPPPQTGGLPAGGSPTPPTPDDYYTYGQPGGPTSVDVNPPPPPPPPPRALSEFSEAELDEMVDPQYKGHGLEFLRGYVANRPYYSDRVSEQEEYQFLPYQGQGYKGGGPIESHGYYQGQGSGRDDLIDAKLSDGEFVMDAETVALLGDGSNDEGARRLEEMRQNLRRHKGKKLTSGKFSPDAKQPEEYFAKGGNVKKQPARALQSEDDEILALMSQELGV